MARAANQKLKILYILKLLEQSDETHIVTMKAILGELAAHGIQAERKRIYDDLEALRRFGYPIIAKRGRMAGYYLEASGQEWIPAGKAAEQPQSREDRTGEGDAAEKYGEAAGFRAEPAVSGELPDWLSQGDTKVELSCAKETARCILEGLGGKSPVRVKVGKRAGHVLLKMKVKQGSAFYGWLAGFGCQVRLEGPPAVIKEYRRFLKEIRNLYKEG